MLRWSIFAASLVALVPGCKLFRHEPGRVIVRDGKAATSHLLAAHVDGKSEDLFDGRVTDAVIYPSGKGLLAIDDAGAGFFRSPARGAIHCKAPSAATLIAVDADGSHVLLATKDDPSDKSETVHFIDLASCAETTLAVRREYGGDVAADGSEAAFGAFPATCTKPWIGDCPATLYRLRPSGSPVATEVLRSGPYAHYQPRYFPDGKIVFQTTELDKTCDGTMNRCRHDIVAIDANGGPGSPLSLIRSGAVSPALSPDGKKMAYVAHAGPGTDCHDRVPCDKMALKIGDFRTSDDSKDVVVAKDVVSGLRPHPFSIDGGRIAFSEHHESEPFVCRVDGTRCRSLPGARVLGWMK